MREAISMHSERCGGSGLALALGVRLELLPVRVKAFAAPADSVGGAHTVGALSDWLHARHAAWCTSDCALHVE
jgi:hypothetical protein